MANSKIVDAIHKQGLSKMGTEDRQAMERQLKELKDSLGRVENPRDGTSPRPEQLQNVPHIKAQIRKLEEILTKDDDLIPKGADKDKVKARVKEIEAIIKKELPTEREQQMRVTISQADFERAVQKTMYHQKKYGKLILEWQELMRRLEPEDPGAADVSKLL